MTSRADKGLVLLIGGRRAGTVEEGPDGRLSLTYDDAWRADPASTPLSISMPLATAIHHDEVVRAFLWGLLPDSEQVLERWARTFHVSARNPFALLRHVGEDCAGACQLVAPERVEELLAAQGGVDWIGEEEIANRLRALRRDPAGWHAARGGQFSLAGAQAKTALYHDPKTGRWGDPYGVVPTTHILKPAIVDLDDHDLNEHLCLEAARGLGLLAARSWVQGFAGERAIVIERYDRVRTGTGAVVRVHQEDACQALGLPPTLKYQNEGGPTPEQILAVVQREVRPGSAAERGAQQFVDALALNWVIGGTDAHAKNYSLLLDGGQVRLAPLYDLASALPYDTMYVPKLRLAMRIGGEYRLERVDGRHWRRLAAATSLDPEATVARIDRLAARTPACLAAAGKSAGVPALGSELPARLLDQVGERARRCRDALRR